MTGVAELLLEFDFQLNENRTSISTFLAEIGTPVSDAGLEGLVGVFAEHQLRKGEFPRAQSIKNQIPQISFHRIEELLAESLENFVESFCPASEVLGQLPAQHDQFMLVREIGRGGSGVVYEARQTGIDRVVAIKVSFSPACDMAQEGTALSRLDHPSIAKVYGVGKIGHFSYLAMQYIDGESLKSFCRSPSPLDPVEAVELVVQLLEAVASLHAHGLAHRDLKPSNVILNDGRPVIIDFGVATPFYSDHGLAGSPGYMPPEITEGPYSYIPVLHDVFSVGVVLYELLTGAKPYGKAMKTQWLPPRRCKDLQPQVDRELDRICLKAISTKPENRFSIRR